MKTKEPKSLKMKLQWISNYDEYKYTNINFINIALTCYELYRSFLEKTFPGDRKMFFVFWVGTPCGDVDEY